MSHSHYNHCHCGLKDQLAKFRAGKLGVLGGIFLIGHLLFHVAECLVLPAILIGANGAAAEAVTELETVDMTEPTFTPEFLELDNLRLDFSSSLELLQIARK